MQPRILSRQGRLSNASCLRVRAQLGANVSAGSVNVESVDTNVNLDGSTDKVNFIVCSSCSSLCHFPLLSL